MPVPPLRDPVKAERERLKHTGKAEHADGKERTFEPQHGAAERQRRDGPGQRGRERGQIPGNVPVKDQERADIGADAEKADLAEMAVAGVTADQFQE